MVPRRAASVPGNNYLLKVLLSWCIIGRKG
nr:MAG TPA: hypothetical protein [Caudoviricetes sp.]